MERGWDLVEVQLGGRVVRSSFIKRFRSSASRED